MTVELQVKIELEIQRVRNDEAIDPTLAAWRIGALEWTLDQAGVKRLPPGTAANWPTRPVLEHPSRRFDDRVASWVPRIEKP